VYEALAGRPFPDGVQTAENLRAHGLVDAVLPPAELAVYLDGVLTAITPTPGEDLVTPRPAALAPGQAASPAWDSVLRTRDPGRPGASELIGAMATGVVRLRETGLILALARAGGHPCVPVAQDRAGPAADVDALRLARRGMHLAEDLRIPLVTVIDTPGAELSPQAEEQGLASEIVQCIALMINLRTATVAVLLGEGTGGGALALLPADRILAAQHAWLAPLAPEGARAIVYKDTAHAPELAARQRIRSADLASDGIVDRVVPETDALCRDLGHAVHDEPRFLTRQDDAVRMTARLRRYRSLGRTRGGPAAGSIMGW
jgi:acyl-CoA carboxylase subunit beta